MEQLPLISWSELVCLLTFLAGLGLTDNDDAPRLLADGEEAAAASSAFLSNSAEACLAWERRHRRILLLYQVTRAWLICKWAALSTETKVEEFLDNQVFKKEGKT